MGAIVLSGQHEKSSNCETRGMRKASPARARRRTPRRWRKSHSRHSFRQVVECGGKRSATPLFGRMCQWDANTSGHSKAPSPLRSAGALQDDGARFVGASLFREMSE